MPRARIDLSDHLLQVRISSSQRRQLKIVAAACDSDMARVVRLALDQFIDKHREMMRLQFEDSAPLSPGVP